MKLFSSKILGTAFAVILLLTSAPDAMAVDAFPSSITNTATVALPDGYTDPNTSNDDVNNTSSVALTLKHNVILGVTKTNNVSTYIPGGTGTYTIVVTNTGKTAAENVTVSDPLPTGVTIAEAITTCTPAGAGSSCGSITAGGAVDGTEFTFGEARIDAGGSLTYTLKVKYASDLTGAVKNTATATDVPSTATANGFDEDTATPQSDLAIVKSVVDNLENYIPGDTVTYKLVVSNAGPSNVTGAKIADTLPTGVTLSAKWTCTAAGSSSSCAAEGGTIGAGALDLTANIAVGETVTVLVPVVFNPNAGSYTP